MPSLAVDILLAWLRNEPTRRALIDVRSELEFERAHVPGFINAPILRQSERHAVGIAYKQHGPEAALQIGIELVGPWQSERLAAWRQAIADSPAGEGVVMCWRGGMRSQYACAWLAAELPPAGIHQVQGGYKVLRQALLREIATCPPLVVVTGLTGTGKTELLRSLPQGVLDLEAAALHRGSAFGSLPDSGQPQQATFENAVALQILRQRQGDAVLLAEDESRMIGRIQVPDPILSHLQTAPVIELVDTLAARCARLHAEYIAAPLQRGISLDTLHLQASAGLASLRRRLGGAYAEISAALDAAFRAGPESELHHEWIGALLSQYYDKRYQHTAGRHPRQVLMRGDLAACRAWALEFLRHRRHGA